MLTILIMVFLVWLYRVQMVGTNWLGFRTFKPEMISFKDNQSFKTCTWKIMEKKRNGASLLINTNKQGRK